MHRNNSRRRHRWPVTLICALAATIVLAAAEGPGTEPESAPTATEAATGPGSTPGPEARQVEGARIFRDPVTGRLSPRRPEGVREPQLGDAMQRALTRSSEGLAVRTLAGGVQAIDLQGRFQSLSLAHRTDDGSIESTCTHAPQGALRFLGSSGAADHEHARERRDVR